MMQQLEKGLSLRREQKGQSSTFVDVCDGDGWRSVAVGMIHQHHPLQPQQSLLLQMHRSAHLKSGTLAKDTVEDNKERELVRGSLGEKSSQAFHNRTSLRWRHTPLLTHRAFQ